VGLRWIRKNRASDRSRASPCFTSLPPTSTLCSPCRLQIREGLSLQLASPPRCDADPSTLRTHRPCRPPNAGGVLRGVRRVRLTNAHFKRTFQPWKNANGFDRRASGRRRDAVVRLLSGRGA
jgi:hypothetical protein